MEIATTWTTRYRKKQVPVTCGRCVKEGVAGVQALPPAGRRGPGEWRGWGSASHAPRGRPRPAARRSGRGSGGRRARGAGGHQATRRRPLAPGAGRGGHDARLGPELRGERAPPTATHTSSRGEPKPSHPTSRPPLPWGPTHHPHGNQTEGAGSTGLRPPHQLLCSPGSALSQRETSGFTGVPEGGGAAGPRRSTRPEAPAAGQASRRWPSTPSCTKPHLRLRLACHPAAPASVRSHRGLWAHTCGHLGKDRPQGPQ